MVQNPTLSLADTHHARKSVSIPIDDILVPVLELQWHIALTEWAICAVIKCPFMFMNDLQWCFPIKLKNGEVTIF